jgi:hypothetical protein
VGPRNSVDIVETVVACNQLRRARIPEWEKSSNCAEVSRSVASEPRETTCEKMQGRTSEHRQDSIRARGIKLDRVGRTLTCSSGALSYAGAIFSGKMRKKKKNNQAYQVNEKT